MPMQSFDGSPEKSAPEASSQKNATPDPLDLKKIAFYIRVISSTIRRAEEVCDEMGIPTPELKDQENPPYKVNYERSSGGKVNKVDLNVLNTLEEYGLGFEVLGKLARALQEENPIIKERLATLNQALDRIKLPRESSRE